MSAIRQLTFTEEPSWWNSRTLNAQPGEIEIQLEGPFVHVYAKGESPNAARLRQRMGAHFLVGQFAFAVIENATAPAKKG